MYLLQSLLRQVIKHGTLEVIDANGASYWFKGMDGPTVTVKFNDQKFSTWLALSPSMALGKGYMSGRYEIKNGTIYDFLEILARNIEIIGETKFHKILNKSKTLFRRFEHYNPIQKSRQNVGHHYDLSGELYKLFLDKDRQYSCAYFKSLGESLEQAQENKKAHIASKLLLKPGQRVLDIGSGWGGMGLYLAENFGAEVTGITLSKEQLKVSNDRAKRKKLDQISQFHLRDYRLQTGIFDRIVSVGMFEHVGLKHFKDYFAKFGDCLADDGMALLHTIGRNGEPMETDAWIRKYIFPGGYIPSLSEIVPAVENSGLMITDIEFLGLHYAETLKHWQIRFQANRVKVKDLYDEKFCRMWEYYLAASEVAFRHLDLTVFQIQMAKKREIVPITRDYLLLNGENTKKTGINDNRAA